MISKRRSISQKASSEMKFSIFLFILITEIEKTGVSILAVHGRTRENKHRVRDTTTFLQSTFLSFLGSGKLGRYSRDKATAQNSCNRQRIGGESGGGKSVFGSDRNKPISPRSEFRMQR